MIAPALAFTISAFFAGLPDMASLKLELPKNRDDLRVAVKEADAIVRACELPVNCFREQPTADEPDYRRKLARWQADQEKLPKCHTAVADSGTFQGPRVVILSIDEIAKTEDEAGYVLFGYFRQLRSAGLSFRTPDEARVVEHAANTRRQVIESAGQAARERRASRRTVRCGLYMVRVGPTGPPASEKLARVRDRQERWQTVYAADQVAQRRQSEYEEVGVILSVEYPITEVVDLKALSKRRFAKIMLQPEEVMIEPLEELDVPAPARVSEIRGHLLGVLPLRQ